jgi:predicted anti-sigma-YlaC factor YlaD
MSTARFISSLRRPWVVRSALAALAALFVAGCSVQRFAVNSVADLFGSGASVFEQESDPVLVAEALPFGLKLMEALVAEQPENQALLLATAKGYLLYAYAFVWLPAEQFRFADMQRASGLRMRARALYQRAQNYAERAHRLASSPPVSEDVPVLYWNAVSLGLLISASKDQPQWLARLPEVEALLDEALALDADWNAGALHEFAITLQSARSGRTDKAMLEEHYARALALSRGQRASLYVSYAESVAVQEQDRDQFVDLLNRALAVDMDADPDNRLMNVVTQQRARWLLENIDEFIL